MTTIATVRDRVSRRLSGQATVLVDRLNGAIASTSVETCTVEFGNAGLAEGSIIEIDSEQMYVISLSTLTVTMLRGWNGTTAATHLDNSIVYVNPRWTLQEIQELIVEELQSWPMQLGQVETEELVLPAGEAQVAIANAGGQVITRILRAEMQHDSRSTIDRRDSVDFRLIVDADLDEFATGYALQVPALYSVDRTIQIDYLTTYTRTALTTTSTDLETDVGLDARYLDILIYGVMWRAVVSREAGRTAESAVQRGDSERVPPTHLLQTAQAFKQIRDQRISAEIFRMYDVYGLSMTTGA